MTETRAEDCDFCEMRHEVLLGGIPGLSARQFHKESTTGLGVYADIAPLKAGHLLLLTPDHDLTMAAALAGNDERWHYVDAVREAYLRTFPGDGLTILEHGSGGMGHKRQCIEHAHWHFLPFADELGEIIEEDLRPAIISGQAEKTNLSNMRALEAHYGQRNYLFYLDHGVNSEPMHLPARVWVYSLETPLPYQQYTRSVGYRHAAGKNEYIVNAMDWDWALHAGGELVEQTMARQNEFSGHVEASLERQASAQLRKATNTFATGNTTADPASGGSMDLT